MVERLAPVKATLDRSVLDPAWLKGTVDLAAFGRLTRERPAVSAGFAAAGLGVIVVSVVALTPAPPEFRQPPVAATQSPTTARPSSAAAQVGLAPYATPGAAAAEDLAPRGSRARISPKGSRFAASPMAGATGLAVDGSGADLVGTIPPDRDSRVAATPATTRTAARTASIRLGQLRDGDTISGSTSLNGYAELPADHQVWLLWRHAGGAYHVVGACRGGRSFTCGPAALESGGDDSFQLTVIAVGPTAARSLQAGESRDSLPEHVARVDIDVRRASA